MNTQGQNLKSSALHKIEQARTLLNSAREDLCNLEGPGYCTQYEKAGKLDDQLSQLTSKLRSMPPPTGVFTI